ncbi:MAG: hypothetical protein HUK15_05580 [Bacteroidales bacterium]|nr:hypothetical protein [Bacteroidales bacterium]
MSGVYVKYLGKFVSGACRFAGLLLLVCLFLPLAKSSSAQNANVGNLIFSADNAVKLKNYS